MEIQTILVPYDFSEHSKQALTWDLGFAGHGGATVTLKTLSVGGNTRPVRTPSRLLVMVNVRSAVPATSTLPKSNVVVDTVRRG